MSRGVSRSIRLGVDVSGLRSGYAGVARYHLNMLRELRAPEYELEILLYSACPVQRPGFLGDLPLRTGRGIASRSSSYWIQRHLPSILADDAVEVFWGQNQLMPVSLRHSCFRVLTLHDLTACVVPRTMPLRSRLTHRLLMHRVIRAADLVVAVSRATASLAQRFYRAAEKTVVIGEGVGREVHAQSAGDAKSRAAQLLGRTEPFILTVGTIEPRKNHILLLDALDLMESPPLLVVVGRYGWKSSRIRARMYALEAEGRVCLLGYVGDPELSALYGAAELTVYPSLYEGFGLPVLEAMLHGSPVLSSWSSSLPEVGGDAARYFSLDDPSGLAVLIESVLGDREMRETMSRRGPERAAEFCFARAARAFSDAIRTSLCSRRPRSDVACKSGSGVGASRPNGTCLPSASQIVDKRTPDSNIIG